MKHIAVITSPPVRSGCESIPDGAITGNGDLAVILGNSPEGLRIFLSKTDVWHAVEKESEGGLRPVGYIDIPVPAEKYAEYRVEQDMDEGVLRCDFGGGARKLHIEIRVAADENAVLIESPAGELAPVLRAYDLGETTGRNGTFEENGVVGAFRSFDGADCLYETHVFAACRALGGGRWCVFAATNHDDPAPKRWVIKKTAGLTPERFDEMKAAHAAFWKDFWSRSSFRLSDPSLENLWYASQYFLAVSARNPGFPPGLYGNFITVERPNWHSDYHLNYNYQAPFYAACSSNHPELTDCYLAPLEEFVPRGKTFAARYGCGGVLFPCGIAPKGYMTEFIPGIRYEFERPFMGQKSDAIHAADIAVFRWYATRDEDYARLHAYPYLRECLDFFTDYAVMGKDGVYSIPDDAIHEVPYYKAGFDEKDYPEIHDTNNVLTLGLLHMCIPAAVDMARTLGVDADRREKWLDFLARLPEFPTFMRRGKRVYRYTEKGQKWVWGNDVGQQHIYPCGCVGLSSPERDRAIAMNTVKQRLYGFLDGNAVSSFYAIGARIGFDPAYMIDKLRQWNGQSTLPNLLHDMPGGCLEYCVVNALALNEMALQSHQGVVRIFPDWDGRLDCEYEDLRADGAFLVSAATRSGRVLSARIVSEKGGTLRVIYPEKNAAVTVNGEAAELSEAELERGISTAPGDVIEIRTVM